MWWLTPAIPAPALEDRKIASSKPAKATYIDSSPQHFKIYTSPLYNGFDFSKKIMTFIFFPVRRQCIHISEAVVGDDLHLPCKPWG